MRGLDLTVDRGQIVAFLGPNGAGKTTALDMVLGLTEPSAGTVLVYGEHPAGPSPPAGCRPCSRPADCSAT
ncbi:ATP-binding cassette domain-containing protein [Nocardioides sambongensis]|uniref:ATP-binding cassette domain-containing protein n=1 Tax=Nocardioides sambongensis TaxID=2589074 RepID=UPI0022ABB7BC|nr:ATP-binding cassette domain-containing protein [Nocardioides sambongensis]